MEDKPDRGTPRLHGWQIVVALGITQIVSWGSTYYAFALLMAPMQTTLGVDRSTVVGAFSVSLLVAGLVAPWIGKQIDRYGGRLVMGMGSVAAALSLAALSRIHTLAALYLVWAVLGVVMAATLYEAAFAVLAHAFAQHYRRAITALTLIAGFSSTIFWPLTQALLDHVGWRETVIVLAALNLLLCAPLHAFVLPRSRQGPMPAVPGAARSKNLQEVLRLPQFWWLAAAFVGNSVIFAAMSVHVVAILQSQGLSAAAAATLAAVIGPMQVAGRIAEFTIGRRLSPRRVGLIAVWLLPASIAVCLAADGRYAMLVLFAVLYGASNGVMTIVRGVVPAELFGREHYGAVTGALTAPGQWAKASGPLLASLLWSMSGGYAAVQAALIGVGLLSALLFERASRGGKA